MKRVLWLALLISALAGCGHPAPVQAGNANTPQHQSVDLMQKELSN